MLQPRQRAARWGSGLVAISLLAGCNATQQPFRVPGLPGTAGTPAAQATATQPAPLDLVQADPCAESARQEASLGQSLLGAMLGVAGGALAGRLIGDMLGNRKLGTQLGALAGLAIGVKIGYERGNDTYRRQCELHRAALAQGTVVHVATIQSGNEVAGEVIVAAADAHFHAGTARLTPKGTAYYEAMAAQYASDAQMRSYEASVRRAASATQRAELDNLRQYQASADDQARVMAMWNELRIVLTGHTDDQVPAELAGQISEGRARAVAELFRARGVPQASLFYQGAGSAWPVADNRSAQGRQQNNRVEIVVLYGDGALGDYQDARRPDFSKYSENPELWPQASPPRAAAPAPAATRKPAPVARKAPPVTASARRAAPAAPAVAAPPSAAAGPAALEFQGMPLSQWLRTRDAARSVTAMVGEPHARSRIDIGRLFGIGTAHASQNIIDRCDQDRPRADAGALKRLSDGAAVRERRAPDPSDYFLGLSNRALGGLAGPHWVSVQGLSPRAATGELDGPLGVQVFEDFGAKGDDARRDAQPDFASARHSAYGVRGDKGLLVRQFFADARGLRCMDLVIPDRLPVTQAGLAYVVYRVDGQDKVAPVELTLGK